MFYFAKLLLYYHIRAKKQRKVRKIDNFFKKKALSDTTYQKN